jgi:uncharacterized protein (TIGR01244 family)
MSNLNLPQQSEPKAGIICSGQPSKAQFEQAAEYGVKVVVNLRRPAETDPRDLVAEVESAGMKYVNIAIAGPDDLTRENAQALADAIDQVDGPILVHCGSSNRVGALLALKAYWLDGVAGDEAIEFGTAAGMTGLAGTVESLIG